jgi:hypothetical protein
VNQPSRRDRLKPVELLVLSAVLSLFVGLVVLLTTRDIVLAGIFFGVAFIVVLVVMAMFSLSIKPNEIEQHEIDDEDQDHPKGH